jgi:hypothetical protein
MAVCAQRKKPCRRAVSAFVLIFPFPLRFLLAAQPETLTHVLAVVQRGISTFVIQHAGLTVSSGARTGAVTLIQRRRWKAGGFPARERSALGMPSRVLRLGPEPEPPPRQLLLRCSTSCIPAVEHMLFLDGAYAFRGSRAIFHRARRPTGDELSRLLDSLSRRIVRVLECRGLLIADPDHSCLDLVPDSSLDHLQAASVAYRIAIGPQAGRKALTL